MQSRLIVSCSVVAFTLVAACTPTVSEGTGGLGGHAASTAAGPGGPSVTSASAQGPSSTQKSSASSTGSTTPTCADNCLDGNPCTDGSCVDGVCKQQQKAAGTVGNASEGGCVGVCQTDGQCGLSLYTRTFPAAGTWTSQALSAVWTGTNAPPPRGILAVEHAYQTQRTFVWADDGNFYRQQGAAWLAPVAISTFFPGLGATNVRSTAMWQPQASPTTLSLLITTTGTTPRQAFNYGVSDTYVVTPDANNPANITSAVSSGGPPQDSVDMDWSFPVQTAYVGTADWVIFYQHVGTKIYEWNGGNGVYMNSWTDAQSPLWMVGGTPPAPDSVVGAYYYSGSVYFVAP